MLYEPRGVDKFVRVGGGGGGGGGGAMLFSCSLLGCCKVY